MLLRVFLSFFIMLFGILVLLDQNDVKIKTLDVSLPFEIPFKKKIYQNVS